MRFIERLYQKREAAQLEYQKWDLLIRTMEEDEDFKGVAQRAANGTAHKALEKLNGHTNGNGHLPSADTLVTGMSDVVRQARSEAAKKGWSAKRKAEYSARLKANPIAQRPKRKTTWTAEQRAAAAKRMKARWKKDGPKLTKALNKARKAKQAAAAEATT